MVILYCTAKLIKTKKFLSFETKIPNLIYPARIIINIMSHTFVCTYFPSKAKAGRGYSNKSKISRGTQFWEEERKTGT